MLSSLDHIVLICPDIEVGVAAYSTVFGRGPVWRAEDVEGGVATALFKVGNTALELMAPFGEGAIGGRLTEILAKRDGVLTSLAFAAEDIKSAHHTLTRRGLSPSDISKGESQHIETGAIRTWSWFRLNDDVCAGIKTFVLEPKVESLVSPEFEAGDVYRLDHLVINTPNPTRAIAHYTGRLGLRFALDRTIEKFGTRFLFFRIGGLTLEVIHRLGEDADQDMPDTLRGMTWEVADLSLARERLSEAGVNVSDIRTGRKPGTEVFTLRDGTLGIPTLFLAKTPR